MVSSGGRSLLFECRGLGFEAREHQDQMRASGPNVTGWAGGLGLLVVRRGSGGKRDMWPGAEFPGEVKTRA